MLRSTLNDEGPVDAADDRIGEVDQKVDDLEAKIEELRDKQEELELLLAARR